MEQITHFINNNTSTIKNFFHAIPADILILGIICGFFVFISYQKTYNSRKASLFEEICNASKKLSVITLLLMFIYIGITFSLKYLFYYILTMFFGLIIATIFVFIFSHLKIIGIILNNIFVLISGPVTIFIAWFFHSGELVSKINKLFDF